MVHNKVELPKLFPFSSRSGIQTVEDGGISVCWGIELGQGVPSRCGTLSSFSYLYWVVQVALIPWRSCGPLGPTSCWFNQICCHTRKWNWQRDCLSSIWGLFPQHLRWKIVTIKIAEDSLVISITPLWESSNVCFTIFLMLSYFTAFPRWQIRSIMWHMGWDTGDHIRGVSHSVQHDLAHSFGRSRMILWEAPLPLYNSLPEGH